MKKIKILHITDFHFRHNGRLFYSSGKKINNGLILNGHNVLNISDRDITNQRKSIFDIGGKKHLFNLIVENIKNFRPNMILLGHVDRLSYLDFIELKNRYKQIKFGQWFLDPLIKTGPDFEKNKSRFFLKYQFCDANFVTTSPSSLNFVNNDRTFFIPNPIDPSIDVYKNHLFKNEIDVFIAISHGQHRGILKDGYKDKRTKFIDKLTKKATYNIFGYNKNPIWGQKFFDELNKCSMAINLSRGKPIKYYSSDRISALLGNGLLTFIDEKYQYQKLFTKKEIVTFKNINDLNKKILFYKKFKKLQKKIASNGYRKAHKIFNNKLISNFIVNKTMGYEIKKKYSWMDD
ncbi:glycosyltransferase family protein [Candidatus Pelagibacter sp. HIMB1623]|uniref:glycosyltransferase family protein n=1 Tax=Candidatus Pelagibacter sp. HIMB1623 TaxID=3413358 RepID=UPI003F86C767